MTQERSPAELLLSPYRVLDFTDQGGLLCGKILADLGADVIQVEPPGGSSARKTGPFYNDDVHPEKSLFWWALAANKRGITLNLETLDGRGLFRSLVQDAHFVIESFPPGYLEGLGLGYTDLEQINPSLVMVSITPFGQSGPYAHYKAPDLVGTALGGFIYLTGDDDRPPVRVSFPHFYLHGAAAGAAGAMLAHTHRALTGKGQHVDVSCQQAVAKSLAHAPQSWDLEKVIIQGMGVYRQTSGETLVRINWRCKDGYLNYMLQGGSVARSTRALLAWMDEEGMGDQALDEVNWEDLGYGQVQAEVMAKAAPPLERFFLSHTKEELSNGSIERRILLFPVASPKDLLEHEQLKAREFFTPLHHPDLEDTVTYPGAFVKTIGENRVGLRRRPPLIGEHNLEIYQEELGLTSQAVASLMEGDTI